MTKYNEENITEFLTEMEQGNLGLDEALTDYGYLLEDTELDQAFSDWRESKLAIRKTLKRHVREGEFDNLVEDLIDE